jgi:D-allose transport system substrate-binding protein
MRIVKNCNLPPCCHKFLELFLLTAWALVPANILAEEIKLAALISDTANQYWKSFETGLSDTGRLAGIQVDIYTLSNATDAEGQLNQCQAALLKNPKAMLFAAVNGRNLASCLVQARTKGIVLIDVDGNINQDLASKMGVDVAFSVASNNYDLGAKAAQYLTSASGKVLVLEGISGSQPSELRVRGFKENVNGSLSIIASQPANWDRLQGYEITSRILLQHPDLSVIFAANDTMALGALEALRASSAKGVKVVGIDGSADAIKSIKQQELTATIAQLPYLMAKEAVEKAVQYLVVNRKYEFQQYVPIVTLDSGVLKQGNEALLKYLR